MRWLKKAVEWLGAKPDESDSVALATITKEKSDALVRESSLLAGMQRADEMIRKLRKDNRELEKASKQYPMVAFASDCAQGVAVSKKHGPHEFFREGQYYCVIVGWQAAAGKDPVDFLPAWLTYDDKAPKASSIEDGFKDQEGNWGRGRAICFKIPVKEWSAELQVNEVHSDHSEKMREFSLAGNAIEPMKAFRCEAYRSTGAYRRCGKNAVEVLFSEVTLPPLEKIKPELLVPPGVIMKANLSGEVKVEFVGEKPDRLVYFRIPITQSQNNLRQIGG